MTTTNPTPDPLTYGPSGYRCGCGKDAHSNLTPCQPTPAPLSPEREAEIREARDGLLIGVILHPTRSGEALRDALAELDRARAEHEPYEMLTEQGCQAGKHPTWLVDSEDHHACPWCEIDRLRAERQETNAKLVERDVALRAAETERDDLRKQLAEANAETCGLANQIVDWRSLASDDASGVYEGDL